jgi:hypothetical protein
MMIPLPVDHLGSAGARRRGEVLMRAPDPEAACRELARTFTAAG